MNPVKKFFSGLGILIILFAVISGLFFLFRTYNLFGLGVLLFIFQVLVPRDSIMERMEMKKIQNQKQVEAN
ncbi:hypothetical protein [Nodularia sp. UHCC 0506]|uniref:hypothetical protein n=1 Tax=Nodularia sp. UHCC 0506 TaxID=3110243 RepID=UPI002B210732|nr:hypothetical protein [Nodularia sp. UHCC 0506]MEA5516846.1 hypothetical protein [Nodularia sp. UHCC 0506]